MRYPRIIFVLGMVAALAGAASAQHWQKVLSLPSSGSAAAFINASVGCIGTGNYGAGTPAQIWYTTNGGTTWTQSILPNPRTVGQVTDIYFHNDLSGWATIQESIEHGWSGIYHTVDGGRTWQLTYQAIFPVSIRETGKGVFYTDRYTGVKRSVDGGNTFVTILASAGALGLDFMNDNVGIVTTEGDVTMPYYTTIDGGVNWLPYDARREAWGAFADGATKRLFFSSEHDIPYPGSQSYVGYSADFGLSVTQSITTDSTDGFTGGISGARGCRSVIYIQRQRPGRGNTKQDDGLMRSTDAGNSWVAVGGPYHLNDKRFGVTGRGAVVFAFDRLGNVWRTTDGGDGLIEPSVLPQVLISVTGDPPLLKATFCDSAKTTFKFYYAGCDSVSIASIAVLDDSLNELRSIHKQIFFGYAGTSVDSATLVFKPAHTGRSVRHVRFRIRQADGYVQDTIITINVEGVAAPERLTITEVTADSLGFGTRSVCGDDSIRVLTLTNMGCSPITLSSVQVSGASFSLRSGFSPVSLDPGFSKQYLIRFKPTLTGSQSGALIIETATLRDSIILRGIGRSGGRGMVLSQSQLTSTLCDSAVGIIVLKNISCSALRLDSLSVPSPFTIDPFSLPLFVPTDSTIVLRVHFVPQAAGNYSAQLLLYCYDVNQPFDTSFTVFATAHEGAATMSYSPVSFDFDTVSICSSRDLELAIVSTGCDTLDISSDVLSGDKPEFTVTNDLNSLHVLSGDTTRMTIHFQPNGAAAYNGNIHVSTNAGTIDIPITGYGSRDPGTLTISSATLATVLTCKDTTFSIKLENTTCDSLTFDSTSTNGAAAFDFTINPTSTTPLGIGHSLVIGGVFAPLASGSRDATITCYLHRADGTPVVISSALHGHGIQPLPVRVDLPAGALTAAADGEIIIPITVLDTCYVDVRSVELVLALNTDLLEPASFDIANSVLTGGSIRSFDSGGDTAIIVIDVKPGYHFHPGLLGTMGCKSYVTDTMQTPIAITRFDVYDDAHSNRCLPTSLPTQSQTSFTLIPACGTSTLVTYLKSGGGPIVIEGIVPNPTSGQITLHAAIKSALTQDLQIEIIDERGAVVERERIAAANVGREVVRIFTVTGAGGTRTLRLSSGSYSSEERFLLVR